MAVRISTHLSLSSALVLNHTASREVQTETTGMQEVETKKKVLLGEPLESGS